MEDREVLMGLWEVGFERWNVGRDVELRLRRGVVILVFSGGVVEV